MKPRKSINQCGLWAIRSDRHPEGRVVDVEKDRWGFYWPDHGGWQKARAGDEDGLEAWRLQD